MKHVKMMKKHDVAMRMLVCVGRKKAPLIRGFKSYQDIKASV